MTLYYYYTVCYYHTLSLHIHHLYVPHIDEVIYVPQPMIYVPLLVNGFQKSILLIVQYAYFKSCSEDVLLQVLILRTSFCGTAFISQHCWFVDFHLINMIRRKRFVPVRYQLPKGKSSGQALPCLNMMHRVGWTCHPLSMTMYYHYTVYYYHYIFTAFMSRTLTWYICSAHWRDIYIPQSIIDVPVLVSRFQECILLIVQHKYLNMIHRVGRTSPSILDIVLLLHFLLLSLHIHSLYVLRIYEVPYFTSHFLLHFLYHWKEKCTYDLGITPPLPLLSTSFSLSLSLSLSLSVSLTNTHTQVFQLLGGTCSSFVCYVLPAMFAIRLQLFAHRPFMNAMTYLLAFMGALAGVLSTGVTLYGFAHPSRGGPSQCDWLHHTEYVYIYIYICIYIYIYIYVHIYK